MTGVSVRELSGLLRLETALHDAPECGSLRKIRVPGTEFETSRFIFGTSSLFRTGTSRARRRLLDAVVDNGFLHFDTAPYYGFGVAERDLAPVLRAHPEVRVTTKVGIYSPGGENQPPLAVFLRKVAGKLLPAAAAPETSFDLRRADRSLHDSLRRLGRDHVDLYMLHEPQLGQLNADVWVEWLEAQQRAGLIGLFGMALTAERLTPFLDHAPALTGVVQVLDSLARREADVLTDRGRPLQITYGYLSAAQAAGDTTPVPELLLRAIRRNPRGPIIVSTRRPERLAQFARADEDAGD